ncbi:MAG: GerW family sporulation protein [Oscillospiraceae bacterium]
MSQHPINELLNSSMQNLRQLVDVNTIIGDPIKIDDKTTIIPISKVSFGFASGGSDLPTQKPTELFGGGSGSGVSIQPLAFLVVQDGKVELMQMATNNNTADRVVNMVPGVIDKISSLLNKESKVQAAESNVTETK